MTLRAMVANAATRTLSAMFPGYFGTAKHNHYSDFGFPEEVTFELAFHAYTRNGIARAGVDKTVAKTWQDNPWLQEFARDDGDDTPETKAEKEIRARFADLRLWQHLAECDRRGMVGAYSGLIMRLADSRGFDQPVERVNGGLAGLVEVIPAWEGQLTVAEWDTVETSPTYGQPKLYAFSEASVDRTKTQPRQFNIHPDRVLIWSRDGTLHGRSALEPGFNDLLTLEKISGAGGEGFWKNAKSGLSLEIDKDAKLTDMARAMGVEPSEVVDRMDEQVESFNKGFDKSLLLQGITAKPMQVTLPSPEHFFAIALQSFAASLSIPLKTLVGSQTGERASTEDAAEWAKTGMSRRSGETVPNIMALVRRLVRFGILADKDWHLDWASLTETSMSEKIALADKMADVNVKMKDTGEFVFTPEEMREVADFEPLTDADKYREPAEDEGVEDDPEDDLAGRGGGRSADRPFVGSATKKKGPDGAPRKSFNPLQPRGGDGRWVDTGARIDRARTLAGANVSHHERIGKVKRPAAVGKLVGRDVKGFDHSVSNQAIAHAKSHHPNLTDHDFRQIPAVIKAGTMSLGDPALNGSPRIRFRAEVNGVRYGYVAEYRRKQKRLDMVTFYRRK